MPEKGETLAKKNVYKVRVPGARKREKPTTKNTFDKVMVPGARKKGNPSQTNSLFIKSWFRVPEKGESLKQHTHFL